MLIVVAIAALLAMAVYGKRALSGKLRSSADAVGPQYHPTTTTSDFTVVLDSDTKTESKFIKDKLIDPNLGIKADVIETTTYLYNDVTTKTGSESVGALGADIWN